jgi:hypothetical protein
VSVSCECVVLPARGLCDEQITRLEVPSLVCLSVIMKPR